MQGLDERTRDLIQRRVLKRVNDIPSLPQFVIETLKKLDDPKSSAADVANKLSRDEGLVIRVLRLANSAYYGLSRRISSVSEAISFLGVQNGQRYCAGGFGLQVYGQFFYGICA